MATRARFAAAAALAVSVLPVYIGDNQLDALVSVKTREDLIGDIIMLLQSPAKSVISALQSGGTKLHGVLETLSNK